MVNIAIQMEGWSSHNKQIQTEKVLFHSIGTQTEKKSEDSLSKKDPIVLKLQEELTQAQLALEQHQQ